MSRAHKQSKTSLQVKMERDLVGLHSRSFSQKSGLMAKDEYIQVPCRFYGWKQRNTKELRKMNQFQQVGQLGMYTDTRFRDFEKSYDDS